MNRDCSPSSFPAALAQSTGGDTLSLVPGVYPRFTPKPGVEIRGLDAGVILPQTLFGGIPDVILRGLSISHPNTGIAPAARFANPALATGPRALLYNVTVTKTDGLGIWVVASDARFERTIAQECGLGGWWTFPGNGGNPPANNLVLIDCGAQRCGFRDVNPETGHGGLKFLNTDGVQIHGGDWNDNWVGLWMDWHNRNWEILGARCLRNKRTDGIGAGIVSEANDQGPWVIQNCDCRDNGDGRLAWWNISVWESTRGTIKDNLLVRGGIGWRNATNGGRVASTGNTLTGNRTFAASIQSWPGNPITGTTALASEPPLGDVAPPQPPTPPAPAPKRKAVKVEPVTVTTYKVTYDDGQVETVNP